MKKILKIIGTLLLAILIIVGGYLGYMHVNYYRIDDKLELTNNIQNNQSNILKLDSEYTIITNNIGFGAYDQEFSFFMDSGTMKDGTEVVGTGSRASSKEAVLKNTNKAIETVSKENADFIFFQEVDEKSTRAHSVDQSKILRDKFTDYASVYDYNMHTSYLMYPLSEPHGSVMAGLLSFSKYKIDFAEHRQLPVDTSFITKFTDLDRCFTTMRIPCEDDKELVLINAHLSAYDEGGVIRQKQLNFLIGVLNEEYNNGNYVIVGGDFNHLLSEDYVLQPTEQNRPPWVFVFPREELGKNFRIVDPVNADEVASCRSTDMPYKKGVNYLVTVDGFIVSDNIEASSEIIDSDFEYSDHNPVMMKFKLKK